MKDEYIIELNHEDVEFTEETHQEKKYLWGIEKEEGSERVEIFPMNGSDHITIHGEEEAIFFTEYLMNHFRKMKNIKGA